MTADVHLTREQLQRQIATLQSTLAALEQRLEEIETERPQDGEEFQYPRESAASGTTVETPLPIAAG